VLDELLAPRTFALITRSLALVVVVTGLCVLIGTTLAVLITRTTLRRSRLLAVALALPMAIPSYVAAYLWISALPELEGFWGAVLVLTLVSYPYVLLPVTAALHRIDPAHEEVARSLGRSSRAVLFGVTLRQCRAAIAAGGLLVGLYVLSDFGAVGTMRYESFTWVIYGAYRAGFNPSRAAILSVVLLVFATILVIAEARARGRAAAYRMGAGVARPAPALALRPAALMAALLLIGVVLLAGLVFPIVELGRSMAAGTGAAPTWDIVGAAVAASLSLSLSAALATTLMALPVALLAARYTSRSAAVIERLTFLTHALPGIVVAIAGVYLGVRLLRPFYQTAPLLVLAYVVLFLPLAIGSIRAAVESSPPRLEEVATSLGRGQLSAFLAVTARLAAPGVAAGAALVFLACMKELPATLLLHPTGTETLATGLWKFTSVSDYGAAAPYAAALVLFAAVPTAVLAVASGRAGEIRGH
jgi:iron(III) transport system permease protein